MDLIIPLKCVSCGEVRADKAGLCPRCWDTIPFISKPFCAQCGLPFEFEIEEGAKCGACSATPPFYTTARSVFSYTPTSRDLILRFKHLDGIHSAPLFGEWMAQRVEMPERAGILCLPVPLHWTRLFRRTYNQAALLAQEIAKRKGWVYAPRVLLRTRRTPAQGHLSKKERLDNVKRAFRVSAAYKEYLRGKRVVLVDDVLTTGATLNACSKALRKAGAREVHVVTLGRVGGE